MKITKYFIILNVIFSTIVLAQFGRQVDHIKIKTFSSLDKFYANTENKVALKVDIEDTWHINSNKPYEEFLIPTSLSLKENN